MISRKLLFVILAAPLVLMGAYWTSLGFLNVHQNWTAGQGVAPSAMTDATSLTSDAAVSDTFTVTLTTHGPYTLVNPTNLNAGQYLSYVLTQDGTGGRTIGTYGTFFKFIDGTPILSVAASSVDVISCVADTSTTLRCVLAGNVNSPVFPLLLSSAGTATTANSTQFVGMGISTTENQQAQTIPQGGTLKNLYVSLSAAPGSGHTYTATLRVNAASPVSGPTCTITNAATSCSDTSNTAAISAGQTFDLQIVGDSSITVARVSAGMTIQ